MARQLLLVGRARRPPPGAHPSARSTARALGTPPAPVLRHALHRHVRRRRARQRHPVYRLRGFLHERIPGLSRFPTGLGHRTPVFRSAPGHSAVPRSGPLCGRAPLSTGRLAPVLHSRADVPDAHRHHGRVHPAAHGAVRSPPVVRRRRGRTDRRIPGRAAGARRRTGAESPRAGASGSTGARRVLRRRSPDSAGRLSGHVAGPAAGARSSGGRECPSRRLRGLGGDAGDDAEPAADLPAGRRAYSLRDAAALAPAHRVRVLVSHHPAGGLVVGVVHVGRARARFVARAPRPSAGARLATTAARVAALARMGRARAVRGHVCSGPVPPLTRKVGGGWWRFWRLGRLVPSGATSPNLHNLPNLPNLLYCVSPPFLYLYPTQPTGRMPAQPARFNAPDSGDAVVPDLPPIRFDGQLIPIRLQVRRSEDGVWRGRVLFGAADTEAERATAEIFCATSEPDLWQAVRDLRDHHLRDLYRSLL